VSLLQRFHRDDVTWTLNVVSYRGEWQMLKKLVPETCTA